MAARLRRRERMVHQRGPDAELAGGSVHRQRAEHERRDAPGADVPQPHGAHEPALAHGRQGEAFGGRASVAQALAGARMAVVAKAGIQQRFARSDVRGPLRTDRERSGIRRVRATVVFRKAVMARQSPLATAVTPREALSEIGNDGEGAGAPAPD